MKYPMKEVRDIWSGGTIYREMTPSEYQESIEWFRDCAERYRDEKPRRYQEYVAYLDRWFGNGKCDGWNSFEERYARHELPMSMNVYFG